MKLFHRPDKHDVHPRLTLHRHSQKKQNKTINLIRNFSTVQTLQVNKCTSISVLNISGVLIIEPAPVGRLHVSNHTVTPLINMASTKKKKKKTGVTPQTFSSSPALISPASRKWNLAGTRRFSTLRCTTFVDVMLHTHQHRLTGWWSVNHRRSLCVFKNQCWQCWHLIDTIRAFKATIKR